MFRCGQCGLERQDDDFLMAKVMTEGLLKFCRMCVSNKASIPDVWYGYGSGVHSEENIADPKTGQPIPFWDKKSKAEAMKKAGVRESGDKVHGARLDSHTRRKYFI